jgi:hypothetical protein
MPLQTRLFIRAALAYLIAALALGVLLVLPPTANLPLVRGLSPSYFHLFMVGWVTQMIFGVIFWMFPIISRARPRGNEALVWAAFVLLNGGLLLRVISEPLVAAGSPPWAGWLLVVSAAAQWLAAVCFVIAAWPRVKEKYRGG